MENAKKILVCPLNWGLGHATRCVPLIRCFLQEGKDVVIAADGYPLQLLRDEFPQLTFVEFPSYKIRYGKGNSQIWAMLKYLPDIITGIFKEHQKLKKIVAGHNIDTVFSDNRFGLWHSKIRSIYMTHQLMIKMPKSLTVFEPLVAAFHRFFIKKYDLCLVPDEWENGGWAGDLTHKYALPENVKFIGILSRFTSPPSPLSILQLRSVTAKEGESLTDKCNSLPCEEGEVTDVNIFAVISGIEPQRSIFENILIDELSRKDFKSLIVSGLPKKEKTEKQIGNVKIVSHLSSGEMKYYLQNTPTVICRSGYSSVMDLAVLGRSAVLVPTPGQTEQEYLGGYLSENKDFICVRQGNLRKFLAVI